MKYLALGDSYTIGELVSSEHNFPNQLVALSKKNIQLDRIIATTGWTTDELTKEIAEQNPPHDYDLVTLLIGVNNQYRERELAEYKWQLYSLIIQSIFFAKGKAENVIILSIPDWGLTPFNTKRDKVKVSAEINAYNKLKEMWANTLGCTYLDITHYTRQYATHNDYLTEDKLHLTKKMYALWAQDLWRIIERMKKWNQSFL